MAPFLETDYSGVRQYDADLITILKDTDRITSEELLRRLDIDQTNTDLMQAIDAQLQQLESYGLITHTTGGWRWLE